MEKRKQEAEQKRKEEAEKKRKMIEEKKQSKADKGGETPKPNKAKKLNADESDDPIAKSLKQRIAAGGVTAVIVDKEAKK